MYLSEWSGGMVAFLPVSVAALTLVHEKVQVVDQALCVIMHEIITQCVNTMEKAKGKTHWGTEWLH